MYFILFLCCCQGLSNEYGDICGRMKEFSHDLILSICNFEDVVPTLCSPNAIHSGQGDILPVL